VRLISLANRTPNTHHGSCEYPMSAVEASSGETYLAQTLQNTQRGSMGPFCKDQVQRVVLPAPSLHHQGEDFLPLLSDVRAGSRWSDDIAVKTVRGGTTAAEPKPTSGARTSNIALRPYGRRSALFLPAGRLACRSSRLSVLCLRIACIYIDHACLTGDPSTKVTHLATVAPAGGSQHVLPLTSHVYIL